MRGIALDGKPRYVFYIGSKRCPVSKVNRGNVMYTCQSKGSPWHQISQRTQIPETMLLTTMTASPARVLPNDRQTFFAKLHYFHHTDTEGCISVSCQVISRAAMLVFWRSGSNLLSPQSLISVKSASKAFTNSCRFKAGGFLQIVALSRNMGHKTEYEITAHTYELPHEPWRPSVVACPATRTSLLVLAFDWSEKRRCSYYIIA